LVKRVGLAIEKRFALDDKRRHPGMVVFINVPRKPNEGILVRA
jgi:hypothetical protein